MFAQLVTNDDEFQILIFLALGKLIFQNGKGFNEPVQVLVRPDFPGVEDKRIFELIALQDLLSLVGSVRERKAFIKRIVYDRNLRVRKLEDVDQIFFC